MPRGRDDEDRLVADMIELARQYGRYGYRRIAALLRDAGWQVNDKRVERSWRLEGLKVPARQPKRGRLWLNDGSCVRLRAVRANHVWSYDFVHHRTHDGRASRTLNVLDEYTQESSAIRVRRKLSSVDVIDVLTDLFILRGPPAYIRSDNGPEFVAVAVRRWIAAVGAQTAFIEPGSPRENSYIESFNARLRDELLDGEIFYTVREAQVVIEEWRRHYNTVRPHSSLGYRPPAPETVVPPSWPPGQLGGGADHALTFKLDQSVGPDQRGMRLAPRTMEVGESLNSFLEALARCSVQLKGVVWASPTEPKGQRDKLVPSEKCASDCNRCVNQAKPQKPRSTLARPLGRGLILPDPEPGRCECDGGEEVSGELVISGCDGPEVFESVEEALDEVALSVDLMVDGSADPDVALAGDVGLGAAGLDQVDDRLGVVSPIGDHVSGQRQAGKQLRCRGLVGGLAGGDD